MAGPSDEWPRELDARRASNSRVVSSASNCGSVLACGELVSPSKAQAVGVAHLSLPMRFTYSNGMGKV